MLCTLSGELSGLIWAALARDLAIPIDRWSIGTGGGAPGAYWRAGIAFREGVSGWRGKLADWGVSMGDEMLTPLTDLDFGDLKADRNEAVREPELRSSLALWRFRLVGFDFSFFSAAGVGFSKLVGREGPGVE
jgi:hypothetical protein